MPGGKTKFQPKLLLTADKAYELIPGITVLTKLYVLLNFS